MRFSIRETLLLGALLLSTAALGDHTPGKPAVIRSTSSESDGLPDDDTFYHLRLNSGLGIHVLQTSALTVSGQMGYAFFGETPFFLGPELSFALFNGGSLFGVWASGWYERRLSGAPKLSLLAGVSGGPSFASHVAPLPTTTWSVFLDLGASEVIDDLASIRVQLRPGIDGGRFAFIMGLVVSFRFL